MQNGKDPAQAIRRTEEAGNCNLDPDWREGTRRVVSCNGYQSIGIDREGGTGTNSFITRGKFPGGVITHLITQSREQLEQYKQRVKETEALIKNLELLLNALDQDEDE